MDLFYLEFFQQIIDFFGLRYEIGRTDQRLPCEILRLFQMGKQVFDVQNTFDGVQIFTIYRQAGIPVFDYHIFDYFETIFDIQGYNVDAGTDDIDGSDIAEPYDSL